jgi:hypothetical protein
VTSLSDTPRLQYYDVQTLEYRYISKLPMKNERIWSYVKETTSHLQLLLSGLLDFCETLHSCSTLPADVLEEVWLLSKI